MNLKNNKTIDGDEIFFNFRELNFTDQNCNNIIEKLHFGNLDGVVIKDVFSNEEVGLIIDNACKIPEKEKLSTYVGQSFPHDFGTVTDSEERMDNYLDRLASFNKMSFELLTNRLEVFFNKIGGKFKSSVPRFKKNNLKISPGNFRFLLPNKGGLFVHCGFLLQESATYFYDSLKRIKRDGQLSFFLMLQYPEDGGELTIYDLLWKDVNKKDFFEQNEYVIGADGHKIFLKDVKNFKVKPQPGDIVVFNGGPIWHRVEDIKGTIPRITFGGFINFSEDDKSFYHWA